MSVTVTRFDGGSAPCGSQDGGERTVTADQQGLMTEDVLFTCGCNTHREEFHDGSLHHLVRDHHGKVLVDEEFRGE